MSEPISVGDLVQAVRACCDGQAASKTYGAIGVVSGFNTGSLRCPRCGFSVSGATWAEFGEWFPPLGELDNVKRDEDITA